MNGTKEFDKLIENIDDPTILKWLLQQFLWRIESLEKTIILSSTSKNSYMAGKIDRLNVIKHWIIELTERMERSYIMPSDLAVVVDTLEVLGNEWDCNSLIIEGMPGTWKTQLAYSMAWEKLKDWENVTLIHLRVKDSLKASELLYSVDDVRRLSDAETKTSLPEDIKSESEAWKQKILNWETTPTDSQYVEFKKKLDAIKDLWEVWKDLNYLNYIDLWELWEAIYQSQFRKVYLVIDEIEKWDEALMTWILDEIENLEFTIRETWQKIKWKKENLKIIITTNTEDSDKIPPSFRRRSLYHFQNYPTREEMSKIVESYFPEIRQDLLDYALDVFYSYHENDEIEKQPSTPELLSWLRILIKNYPDSLPQDIPYKQILLKYKEDQNLDVTVQWLHNVVSTFSIETPNYVKKSLNWEEVFFLSDRFNNHKSQSDLKELYADLQNEWIKYILPKFQETTWYDEDNQWYKSYQNIQNFQIIAPGVQYLWDWAYIITDKKIKNILENYNCLSQRIIVRTNLKFSSIEEKNNNYVKWYVNINGDQYLAYLPENSSDFVVVVYYHDNLYSENL